jgi:sulfide dehydrogenase cytochrome subunit
MRIKYTAVMLLFCSSLTMAGSGHAVEITQGMMLANSCAGCHGTDGKSPGAIPAINGKSADYIAQSMRDFQSGKRPSTVMGRHANGYSEQEIQMIADFFANN